MKLIILLTVLSTTLYAASKNDSLVFNNGDIMVGEIKSMDRGVIQVKTDYSDSDFKIEWIEIRSIKSETSFFISLTDGRKLYGTVESVSDSVLNINTIDNQVIACQLDDIIYLNQIKKTFLDRFSASIDIGFSLTKANNLKQLSSRSSIGYRTQTWSTTAVFNTLKSTQDDTDPIERSDGKLTYANTLPFPRLYAVATVAFESNTQQKLDLRMNAQLGLGRFFVRTNYAYWGIKLGVNRNVERFSSETADRDSWEGYLGTELNLYNIGDLNLFTLIMAYPGITARERFRSDMTFDLKYDLPLDFYLKLGFTINYDNKPAEGATEFDYVIQTGFGWEW